MFAHLFVKLPVLQSEIFWKCVRFKQNHFADIAYTEWWALYQHKRPWSSGGREQKSRADDISFVVATSHVQGEWYW